MGEGQSCSSLVWQGINYFSGLPQPKKVKKSCIDDKDIGRILDRGPLCLVEPPFCSSVKGRCVMWGRGRHGVGMSERRLTMTLHSFTWQISNLPVCQALRRGWQTLASKVATVPAMVEVTAHRIRHITKRKTAKCGFTAALIYLYTSSSNSYFLRWAVFKVLVE